MAAASAHADYSKAGFGTKVIHCGQEPDATTGAVAVPISMSTTFAQVSPGIASVS
jgi:cystathionine gamma-lyase